MNQSRISIALLKILSVAFVISGCEISEFEPVAAPSCSEALSATDVQQIIAHAVELSQQFNQTVAVAITDREGDTLGVFLMSGTLGSIDASIAKARTAAYLSSNQHGFTTITACFITRPHFPPGIANTPGGPLFGVPFSSLAGGDVQPNGSGLAGAPGGVPIFKNGCLVGGIGITSGSIAFDLTTCGGQTQDEAIALGAVIGYAVPLEKRGDNIFLDGIRLRYANALTPAGNFTAGFDPTGLGSYTVAPRAEDIPRFPVEGEVLLGGGFDFPIIGGSSLTATEVRGIINQAVAQANRTRAAIRRPLGSAARVFISVVDVDGSILGIWRTPDATFFSFDVSAQKARTAVAFSDPNNVDFGQGIRTVLNLSSSQELAMTTRAVGFLSQDFFPPGIDRDSLGHLVGPGPLFGLQQTIGLDPFGNGITIFPGGIPLYKNGQLVGAIGVSGDGVDQDDLIASAGAAGFEPAPQVRSDQFYYQGVRLPFIKIPRNPELP